MSHIATTLVTLALLSCALPGQTGNYVSYGSGCPGSGRPCVGKNVNGGSLVYTQPALDAEYAFAISEPKPLTLVGFEIFFRSWGGTPVPLDTFAYTPDAKGLPGTAIRSSKMVVSQTAAWYRSVFSIPVVLKANDRIFVSVRVNRAVMRPFLLSGQATPYYLKEPSWRFINSANVYIGWRALCAPDPALSNIGVPTIGRTFSVLLTDANPLSLAMLVTGFSRTQWGPLRLPFDMTGLGAKGCFLRASIDLVAAMSVDRSGRSAVPWSIPNDSRFVGFKLYQQWIVFDRGANPLGMAFSNGGEGTVGK